MSDIEKTIVAKAKELAAALKDSAYTRKDEDKKRVQALQMDLIRLCENT